MSATRPYLKQQELRAEIAKRTGASLPTIDAVMSEMTDIIQTCLLNGVEVRFPALGKFTFTDYIPMRNVLVFNHATRQYEEKEETPGYRKPRFSFSRIFKKYMIENTTVTYDELFPDEAKTETETEEEKENNER